MKINIDRAIESFRINFSGIKREGAEDLLRWIEEDTQAFLRRPTDDGVQAIDLVLQ